MNSSQQSKSIESQSKDLRGSGDRDRQGRFQSGCKPGPGRPSKRTEMQYVEAMASAVSPEDFEAICRKAVEQARKGDARARAWLSDHLLGRPIERRVSLEVQNEVKREFDLNLLTKDELRLMSNLYDKARIPDGRPTSAEEVQARVRQSIDFGPDTVSWH